MTANGSQRPATGQLTALVVRHRRAHPRLDVSPYELAKVLRRSGATIRRRLFRLVGGGTVIRTGERPGRFRTVI